MLLDERSGSKLEYYCGLDNTSFRTMEKRVNGSIFTDSELFRATTRNHRNRADRAFMSDISRILDNKPGRLVFKDVPWPLKRSFRPYFKLTDKKIDRGLDGREERGMRERNRREDTQNIFCNLHLPFCFLIAPRRDRNRRKIPCSASSILR